MKKIYLAVVLAVVTGLAGHLIAPGAKAQPGAGGGVATTTAAESQDVAQAAAEYQKQLDDYTKRVKRSDDMMKAQEASMKRSEALMARQEEFLKRGEVLAAKQEQAQARYDKILETWEKQQKQYQKYLDGLGK